MSEPRELERREAERREVVVVGAGFAGLYQLHRLRALGFDVVLLEAGDDLGGIWHWNCYPGARVDTHVPIYEYSDPAVWRAWYWTERYPGWEELRAYFDHVDRVWDLRRDIRFGTRVASARWDETSHEWTVETEGGDTIGTRWLVFCTGFASKPHVPELAGIDDFTGTWTHTATWPQEGIDLTGRRVGVVGVGASGVQVIQEAAAAAEDVTVFQRTPIMALPMRQEPLTHEQQDVEKASYAARFDLRSTTAAGFDVSACGPSAVEVSDDERQATFERLWNEGGLRFWTGNYTDVLQDERANRYAYDFWRDRVRERIADPRLAELLAPIDPPHPFGVKRPSLEQDYYDVFDQPNVSLVDLKTTPIERLTASGVRTSDDDIDLDVLVFATGFDAVTGGLTQIDIEGTDGTLADHWDNGVHTHLGLAASTFPNLLFVYGPQSPSGFCNGPTCAEVQGDMIIDLLVRLRDDGATRLEVDRAAEAEWRGIVRSIGDATLFPQADSWYMGANVPGKTRELLNFPGLHIYRSLCDDAFADDLRGFVVSG